MTTKVCPACKLNKAIKDYGSDKYRADGLSWQCKECKKKASKKYRIAHPEQAREYYKRTYQKYYSRQKIKRKTIVAVQIHQRMSRRLRESLKGGRKNKPTFTLLSYSVEQLELRLKNTIPSGYTWQDFLDGKLHIDHIVPISKFNYDIVEHIDFSRCWALENLQLLPAKENKSKGNRIKGVFQPSLRLSV